MSAFDWSPGGCCCKVVAWFDVWDLRAHEGKVVRHSSVVEEGTGFAGWNSLSIAEWSLEPANNIQQIDMLVDVNGTIWTSELRGGLKYLSVYSHDTRREKFSRRLIEIPIADGEFDATPRKGVEEAAQFPGAAQAEIIAGERASFGSAETGLVARVRTPGPAPKWGYVDDNVEVIWTFPAGNTIPAGFNPSTGRNDAFTDDEHAFKYRHAAITSDGAITDWGDKFRVKLTGTGHNIEIEGDPPFLSEWNYQWVSQYWSVLSQDDWPKAAGIRRNEWDSHTAGEIDEETGESIPQLDDYEIFAEFIVGDLADESRSAVVNGTIAKRLSEIVPIGLEAAGGHGQRLVSGLGSQRPGRRWNAFYDAGWDSFDSRTGAWVGRIHYSTRPLSYTSAENRRQRFAILSDAGELYVSPASDSLPMGELSIRALRDGLVAYVRKVYRVEPTDENPSGELEDPTRPWAIFFNRSGYGAGQTPLIGGIYPPLIIGQSGQWIYFATTQTAGPPNGDSHITSGQFDDRQLGPVSRTMRLWLYDPDTSEIMPTGELQDDPRKMRSFGFDLSVAPGVANWGSIVQATDELSLPGSYQEMREQVD